MNANKTNSMKGIGPYLAIGGLVVFVSFATVIASIYINSKPNPEPTEKPTTNPPAIDSVTIDKLKACLKLTTTIPVDSHDIVVIPFVGDVVGFTSMHSPACKHKSHK